ncbi:MAG: helix-turn-helix transcriptional regulator [Clostridia bacterium]|nr:helix-turn-helix transcriptional regulator [Clostridia bacterium]
MTFGEKLKTVRLSLNLSQSELSEKTGISERSLYTYEQTGILPRSNNLRKLADALNVSVSYLLDEEETDPNKNIDHDIFIANSKNQYGHKGAREATELLSRASALFAGGELDDEAKELFFQSLMEVYLDSKQEARNKFSPKKRVRKHKSDL